MSSLDVSVVVRTARREWFVISLYSATIFLSAALLFCLEPMFSKMVLPVLGGSAAVWSVAMVVFQGLLLAGYVYAHVLTRLLPAPYAGYVHLILMAAATVSLPIAISAGFSAPPADGVSVWLIGLFLASIGLPCFAISANAPLLQAWFAESNSRFASNPYFLYRASNAGSFLVLLAYPFLIEPALGLAGQARFWNGWYTLLMAGIAACASYTMLRPGTRIERAVVVEGAPTVSWSRRLAWVALGFVPSGLLVAVTAHIATDVASAPFLWIVPLALYLLTFVLAFADKPILPLKFLFMVQPLTVAVLTVLFLWAGKASWAIALPCHLTAFFVAAMVCHTRLYGLRPAASDLTAFYAWMSLGGVLGGVFAALLAPQLFTTVLEYPLLVLAALCARPGIVEACKSTWRGDGVFVLVLAAVLTVPFFIIGPDLHVPYFAVAVMTLAVFLVFQAKNPVRLLGIAAALLLVTNFFDPTQSIVARARSFYGVYKVVELSDGRFRVLFHGTTAHGGERIRDDAGTPVATRPQPLSYYYRGGPYAAAIDATRARNGGRLGNVALVGLGMGALTCYAQKGENWTLYELDPLVVSLAKDRSLFRSMAMCATEAPVVAGDGRLTLRDAKPGIDLLILDVFSSDSVPTHLLTKEAFALYARKLGPHGVIAFNISNKNMQLANVVAASAAANGMVTAVKTDAKQVDTTRTLHLRAEIAVVAKSRADLEALHLDHGWQVAAPVPRTWTDDYSNVLGAIVQKLSE